jgi:hypothetical protein
MPKATGGATRAAWFVTFMCAALIVGMLVVLWFDRSPTPSRVPYLLIPFLVYLPTPFFAIAREQRGLEEEIHGLRDRVEELERITLGLVAGNTERLPGPTPDNPTTGPRA